SAVATAVSHGAEIFPCAPAEDAVSLAQRAGGEAAVARDEVPEKGRYSLSPLTYVGAPSGTRVVLASPNGAVCSRPGRSAARVFAGALLNASATARAVAEAMDGTDLAVTLLACGERWPQSDDPE